MLIVETETAKYLLDMVRLKLKRFPKDEPLRLEEFRHLPPAAVEDLRKDGEFIPFNFLKPLKIGEPAQFLLQLRNDGVQTIRTTTNVISIHAETHETEE